MMKTKLFVSVLMSLVGAFTALSAMGGEIYPTAILQFEERGAGIKNYGNVVSDVLFASLSMNPDLYLVDRQDIDTLLKEHELSLSGAVNPGQAVQLGHLTGARILITGSIVEADSSLYIIAKIVGTETSRVLGCSVKGSSRDEIAPLVEKLAEQVSTILQEKGSEIVPEASLTENLVSFLNQRLGSIDRPTVAVRIQERHVGRSVIDPAAETELILLLKKTGFTVVEQPPGEKRKSDLTITGEGFSEFAARRGNLVSVKARLELKVIDRASGEVLLSDRQTSIVVDLSEQVAGKAALQQAAARMAERVIPKLVK